MKSLTTSIVITVFAFFSLSLQTQQNERSELDQLEQSLQADVPRVVCLSKSLTTGGQPSEQAFSKLAASGFRSVLNLRGADEGVDLEGQRKAVERASMDYLHIPVSRSGPGPAQVEEFIRVVKETKNHPMLIHCGTGGRVGALMMIYRVLEHGWTEEKALEEAERIGLRSEELKRAAREYLANRSSTGT